MASAVLGKVSPTPKGEYVSTQDYDRLDVVTYEGYPYLAKSNVPSGNLPTDELYWMPLLTGLDFAPGGYGLGGSSIEINDWNNAIENGFYRSSANCINGPTAGSQCHGMMINFSSALGNQLVFKTWTDGQVEIWSRRYYNGTFAGWKPVLTSDTVGTYAAPARVLVSGGLSATGWYKVGMIKPSGYDFTTACRVTIGGTYNYVSPPSAIIDVAGDYNALNAVVTVPSLKNNQITKVGFIKSGESAFDVYAYYAQTNENGVYISVDMQRGTFVKASLESASVSESDMMKVVEPSVGSFAPSGYGLGANPQNVGNADNAKLSGWYIAEYPSFLGRPGTVDVLRVTAYSDKYVTQEFFATLVGYNCVIMRYLNNGVWGEWEWVNPPMTIGVEYRTTERFEGKPVYTMLIPVGEWLVGSYIDTAIDGYVIRQNGIISGSAMPLFTGGSMDHEYAAFVNAVRSDGRIVLYMQGGASQNGNTSAKVQIWYYK